ncbi:UNVERIFIED_CONTAM: hypothetical protein Sangu_3103900 [Sesamum angustifolium]|uniref:Reverse transcriptase zinc-binding domain-containing protein n=1 Tax=Sesamum angustifolium TaxID=2727405 RepID=A0AAW2K8G2_9LAMI
MFCEALDLVDVYDLSYKGEPFTWCNRHPEPDTIYERLDRVCADPAWRTQFLNTVLHGSHPRNVSTLFVRAGILGLGPRSVLFYPTRRCVLLVCWPGTVIRRPILSVHRFGSKERLWHKFVVGLSQWPQSLKKIEYERKWNSCYHKRRSIGNNKGRPTSFGKGIGTRHIFISGPVRRKTNDITRIKNGDDQWLEKEEDIRSHIEAYFGDIFRSRNLSEEELEKGTEAISARVSNQMLQELALPFTTEEVSKALAQMPPLKSPGPNDMPHFFFQSYWHIVHNDVVECTLSLLNDLILPSDLNHTHSFNSKMQETGGFCPRYAHYRERSPCFRSQPLSQNIMVGREGAYGAESSINKAYDKKVEWTGRLLGVAVCRQVPRVSHLLFADDTLIFCQAIVDATLCISEVLEIFGRATGQEINFDKSSVVFSKNIVTTLREGIQNTLQIRVEGRHDLYLGLPSVAGKEVLIKAIAQTIPTYAMGCFRLPFSFIKEIQSMIANFWWHTGEARWFGVSQSPSFNLAMLAKQCVGDFGGEFGSRRSVQVWRDPCLPRPPFRVSSSPTANSLHLRVCDLIDATSREWNHLMVRVLFCHDETESILAIPLSFVDGDDFFVWHHTVNDTFSVRSAYHVAVSFANHLQSSPSCIVPFLWKTIWKANVLGKIRIFIWKLAKNALPTGMNLPKKMRTEGWGCPFCGSEQKDIEHASLRCSIVRH